MTKLATAIAVALVLFVTALPAATACCQGNRGINLQLMQASMSCCAESCPKISPSYSRDNHVTVAPSPSPEIEAAPVVATAALAIAPPLATAATATERTPDQFSAPPPFLLNAQFRI